MRHLAAVLALAALPFHAEAYPTKPIRVVVALAPGGGVDTTARITAQRLAEAWGQQVVVENRPGAGGTIATELVARAAPDGYTLLVHSSGFAITPSLYKLNYDAVADFTPVTLLVYAPQMLVVHPSLPVRSVKELIAFAKARPGELLWSSSGNGSPPHLSLQLLLSLTGMKIVHVPYKGTAPGITDLLAGRVAMTAAGAVSVKPHVEAGRLRALAVLGAKRAQSIPELPTMSEAGVPGYAFEVWYAMFAPAGTPRDVVTSLHKQISRAFSQPELRQRMLKLGVEPAAEPPDQFAAFVKSEIVKLGKLVKESGAKVN